MGYMNGRSSPISPPPDHTSILVYISGQVGEIRGEVKEINRRVAKLEDRPSVPRPLTDYIPPAIGLVILAAAAAGKVTWSDALPSILSLAGR